jgi:Holliday junction resolvasome RuvABC endonuclease subunit
MKILGIDSSLNSTGICILENGVIELLTTVRPPGTYDRESKLGMLHGSIWGIADGLVADRDVAVIEGYAFNSKFQRETMGEVGGVIRLALKQVGIPFTVISPASWQKQLIGRVVAKGLREELLRRRFYLPATKTMDEVEAFALARARWDRYTGAYVVPSDPPKQSRVKAKSQ